MSRTIISTLIFVILFLVGPSVSEPPPVNGGYEPVVSGPGSLPSSRVTHWSIGYDRIFNSADGNHDLTVTHPSGAFTVQIPSSATNIVTIPNGGDIKHYKRFVSDNFGGNLAVSVDLPSHNKADASQPI